MSANKFAPSLAATLRHEGGFSNHPKDPGGATMRGVTQAVYSAYRKRKDLPPMPVKQISDNELLDIYRTQYWRPVRGDDLPRGVDLAVFDFAVNSGPDRAIKHLQRALGLREDGTVGNATLGKLMTADPDRIVAAISASRLEFMRKLATWGTFGNGWKPRVDDIRQTAKDMIDGASRDPRPGLAPSPATAKAKSSDQKLSSTTTGKGAIAGGIGAVGSTLMGAADKIAPLGEFGTVFKIAFAVLVLVGVGFTIYGALKTAKSEEELA